MPLDDFWTRLYSLVHDSVSPMSVCFCFALRCGGTQFGFQVGAGDIEALHSISACQGVSQLCMLVCSRLGYLFG